MLLVRFYDIFIFVGTEETRRDIIIVRMLETRKKIVGCMLETEMHHNINCGKLNLTSKEDRVVCLMYAEDRIYTLVSMKFENNFIYLCHYVNLPSEHAVWRKCNHRRPSIHHFSCNSSVSTSKRKI